jgi:hypothetical protein
MLLDDDAQWRQPLISPDHFDRMQDRLNSLASFDAVVFLATSEHFAGVQFGVRRVAVLVVYAPAHPFDRGQSPVPLGMMDEQSAQGERAGL